MKFVDIESITPQLGSVAGGQLVTLIGTGFSDDAAEMEITIGDVPCSIESLSFGQIVCRSGEFVPLNGSDAFTNGLLSLLLPFRYFPRGVVLTTKHI